jgi:hypothetical protein
MEGTVGKSKISITKEEESVYKTDSCDSVYLEEFDIMKVKDDSHLVFGWANVALKSDGEIPLEWQGDITSPGVLEKAAYNFVLKYRGAGEMHKNKDELINVSGLLVESIMFTKQKMQALGIPEGIIPEGWWVGFYIPDEEICMKIKTGTYKMFSIQGKAKKFKF